MGKAQLRKYQFFSLRVSRSLEIKADSFHHADFLVIKLSFISCLFRALFRAKCFNPTLSAICFFWWCLCGVYEFWVLRERHRFAVVFSTDLCHDKMGCYHSDLLSLSSDDKKQPRR